MIDTILRKMCEFGGVDFDSVNFQDGSHLRIEWTQKQENEFRDWLALEIRTNKWMRNYLARGPELAKKKYYALKIANEFVFVYGFKIRIDNNVESV